MMPRMVKLAIRTGVAIGLYVFCALIVTAGVGCLGYSLAYQRDAEHLWSEGRYVALYLLSVGVGAWLYVSGLALDALKRDVQRTWFKWRATGVVHRARRRLELLIQESNAPETPRSPTLPRKRKRIMLRRITMKREA